MRGKVFKYIYASLALILVPWTYLTSPLGTESLSKLGGEVWYVTFISHVALILALVASWESARVEQKQDESEER